MALEQKSINTATVDDSPHDAWANGYDQGAADYAQPLVSGLAEAEQRTLERALEEAQRLVTRLQGAAPTYAMLHERLAGSVGVHQLRMIEPSKQILAQLACDLADSLEAVQRGR